ncbi:hypothetical protein PR048_021557 [Dryococelus australis]|uniref:Uncharacterized protein n=1 Tax=Dryococelus australis TaxID=614101 RepID=A0ABQ9GYK8_9NEOP|nr:hypothetical protein PR048_021557 [Dryococelus australis]
MDMSVMTDAPYWKGLPCRHVTNPLDCCNPVLEKCRHVQMRQTGSLTRPEVVLVKICARHLIRASRKQHKVCPPSLGRVRRGYAQRLDSNPEVPVGGRERKCKVTRSINPARWQTRCYPGCSLRAKPTAVAATVTACPLLMTTCCGARTTTARWWTCPSAWQVFTHSASQKKDACPCVFTSLYREGASGQQQQDPGGGAQGLGELSQSDLTGLVSSLDEEEDDLLFKQLDDSSFELDNFFTDLEEKYEKMLLPSSHHQRDVNIAAELHTLEVLWIAGRSSGRNLPS